MRRPEGLCLLLLVASGCWSSGGNSNPTEDQTLAGARRELLAAVGQCALGLYRDFAAAAGTLEQETAALAAGTGDPQVARQAFVATMALWQEAELFQFGPAGPRSEPGGQELRDPIYAWPLVNRCAIEQQLVSRAYEANLSAALVSTRGLGAMEYLLFNEGSDNACPPTSGINSSGSWAAIPAEDLAARKRAYAAAAAVEVAAKARELVSAWENGYAAELASAGEGSKTYETAQEGVNAVSNALFYLDTETKDAKLARPAGLSECTQTTCPEALESQWAALSTENVRRNLLGASRLLLGCKGGSEPGFDDLLVRVGAADLASRIGAALAGALAASEALEEADLRDSLNTELESVRALHAAVKGVTDLLKSELVTVLDLDLPQRIEGDND